MKNKTVYLGALSLLFVLNVPIAEARTGGAKDPRLPRTTEKPGEVRTQEAQKVRFQEAQKLEFNVKGVETSETGKVTADIMNLPIPAKARMGLVSALNSKVSGVVVSFVNSVKKMATSKNPTVNNGASKSEIAAISTFLKNSKDVQAVKENKENPNPANVVDALVQNVEAMVNWPAANRAEALAFAGHYNTGIQGGKSVDQAVNYALVQRGYKTPAEQAQRKREILNNCKR